MPLEKLFESYAWESWPEAGLDEAMVYLRTSSMVQILATFKDLIPKTAAQCAAVYKPRCREA